MMSYFAERRPRRLSPLLLVFALALVVAACGGDDDESTGDFNDADVTFAQSMIVHHEQAIEMAELAPSRAENADVKDLAERIQAAQDPEIETMKGWLADWDQPESADGMDGHGGMGSGDGMMSEDDMSSLMDAEGAEFDRMFLEMMTEHHQGAIDMSETELDEGQNKDAKDLAQEIIDAQTEEIDEMGSLLEQG
jgi:uncharacterized protein (DUF305 family)